MDNSSAGEIVREKVWEAIKDREKQDQVEDSAKNDRAPNRPDLSRS